MLFVCFVWSLFFVWALVAWKCLLVVLGRCFCPESSGLKGIAGKGWFDSLGAPGSFKGGAQLWCCVLCKVSCACSGFLVVQTQLFSFKLPVIVLTVCFLIVGWSCHARMCS